MSIEEIARKSAEEFSQRHSLKLGEQVLGSALYEQVKRIIASSFENGYLTGVHDQQMGEKK